MIAAPGASGTFLPANGAATQLTPLDATVTIRDHATSVALPNWNARIVNGGSTRPGGTGISTTFDLTTVPEVTHAAGVTLLALGVPGTPMAASASLAASGAPRFEDAARELSRALALLGSANAQGASAAQSTSNVVDAMRPFAPFLDGALVILRQGDALGAPFDVETPQGTAPSSGFTLFHAGDLQATWVAAANFGVAGTTTVGYAGPGFVTAPVASAFGYVPYVSIALWVVALGLVVAWLIRRPKIEEPHPRARWFSLAAHIVALVVVFVFWDASFAQAFGTSVLGLLRAGNFDLRGLGLTFGLEMVPWTVASFVFALPVRIAVTFGLRFLHRGKEWRGAAKAAGLVVMGLLLGAYALFFLNATLVQGVSNAVGQLTGP
ncbi:MAG: hypothetical protein ACYDCK_06780 [Thermoplasmatota archaeon]